MEKYLIINGDDFGLSVGINRGILECHKYGTLTSASLMVNGFAFDHAVAIAKENVSLDVGLHLNITTGYSILPHNNLPSLTTPSGAFKYSIRSLLLQKIKVELIKEIKMEFEAQIKKFFNSGLKYKSILVTNAKFTAQVIKYSKYVGVDLLGWKHPQGGGLERLIEKNQLYPITILPSVSHGLARILIDQKIVLVKDVFSRRFKKIKISRKQEIQKEAKILWGIR